MKSIFTALFGLFALSSFAVAQTAGKTSAPTQGQAMNFSSKKFSLSTPEIRCYSIRRITLVDESADGSQASSQFYWALDRAKASLQLKLPHCLGDQGLNLLTKHIQSEIAAGGYSGVRVVKPEQDLHSGSLVLNVLVGKEKSGKANAKNSKNSPQAGNAVNAKKADTPVYTDGFKPSVSNKNPSATAQYEAALKKVKEQGGAIVVTANRNVDKDGIKTVRQSVLNANKAEKAKEQNAGNVRVVKGINNENRQADIKTADIKQHTKQKEEKNEKIASGKLAVSGQVGVKGAGSTSNGKWQTDAQVAIHNILAYNDKLQAEFSHSTKPKSIANSKANRQVAVGYEVPFGDWKVAISHKDNAFYREVFAGENQSVVHSGKRKSSELSVAYKLYEDDQRSTSVAASAWTRQSKTDDLGVANEKSRLSGWTAAVSHKEMLGDGFISGKVEYKQATAYKNSADNERKYRPRTINAEVVARKPFELIDESFYVESAWKAQWANKALDLDDQFVVGGIDSVRGFSGNRVIAGSKGWVSRNELGWNIQDNRYTLYTAVDVGQVGRDNGNDEGKRPTLVGSTIGLKGQRKAFHYDFFVAKPITKPKGFKVPKYLIGANVSYRF